MTYNQFNNIALNFKIKLMCLDIQSVNLILFFTTFQMKFNFPMPSMNLKIKVIEAVLYKKNTPGTLIIFSVNAF